MKREGGTHVFACNAHMFLMDLQHNQNESKPNAKQNHMFSTKSMSAASQSVQKDLIMMPLRYLVLGRSIYLHQTKL